MSAVLRSQMPQANVRIAVLMSPAQKRRLARKAKAANLTMGELLRQGGERFSPAEDDAFFPLPKFLRDASYTGTVNIGIFGPSGVGKSTLINTLRASRPDFFVVLFVFLYFHLRYYRLLPCHRHLLLLTF